MALAGSRDSSAAEAAASAERWKLFAFMVRSEIEAHAQTDGAGRPEIVWIIDFQRVEVTVALWIVLVLDRRLVLRGGQIAVVIR